MTDTDFITKEIFQYEKNSEKQEQIIEKQDARLKANENTIQELQAQVETQQKTIVENNTTIGQNEEVIFELNETLDLKSTAIQNYKTQVDEYIKTVEGLKNEVSSKDSIIAEKTKRIEALERTSLNPSELLFYYACKTDLVLYNYVQEGKLNLTYDELKAKKIPVEFLEQVKKQPFETTNYVLTFNDNIYRIKSTKK